MDKEEKIDRVLQLYDKFRKGSLISKGDTALELGVNERTIQRDIEDVRTYLANFFPGQEIQYDRVRKGYYLVGGKANGKGCLMWLLSQGSKVKVVSPISLREEIKAMIQDMAVNYEDE